MWNFFKNHFLDLHTFIYLLFFCTRNTSSREKKDFPSVKKFKKLLLYSFSPQLLLNFS